LKQLTRLSHLSRLNLKIHLIFHCSLVLNIHDTYSTLKRTTDTQTWLVIHERCFVRWGTLSNSATKRTTDIEVLQQAETSLQKASGGFSFFGGRQDKCEIAFVTTTLSKNAFTDARDRRGSSGAICASSKCIPYAEDGYEASKKILGNHFARCD
jgi:hypothetical protein